MLAGMHNDKAIPDPQRRAAMKGVAAAVFAAAVVSKTSAARSASESRPTAVVIGAGIAGLSAAYDLSKSGFAVSIFEKWEFSGGRMREGWMGPLYGFTHAEGVLEANAEMFALANEVGVAGELAGIEANAPLDNGHGLYLHGLRFLVDEVMNVPGMSDDTKRRLPSLQADLDQIRAEVDPCQLATGAQYDDESLGDYYERLLGKEAAREVIRYWVDYACTAWGWPVYSTSKIALLSWFAQQQSRFVRPQGGIGVLTRKLASLISVQNRTSVRYVTPPDSTGRHTVHYLTPQLERRSVRPDVVVCATEGKYIPSIIQGLDSRQEAFFKRIDFTKAALIAYVLDEKAAPRAYLGGTYIPDHPDPIKQKVAGWYVAPADPADHNRPPTARIALSRLDTFKWQASGKAMGDYCFPLMKHFYPALDEKHVIDIVNYTCDDLIYIPVGYVRQMSEVLRQQAKERRGLYFAGEHVSSAHTGAACASGRSIARLIKKHWI